MSNDEPWFQRWFGFSFKPISWRGWAATVAFLLVEAPIMPLSLQFEAESPAWWLLAATGFVVFLGFWAFVLSKTQTR